MKTYRPLFYAICIVIPSIIGGLVSNAQPLSFSLERLNYEKINQVTAITSDMDGFIWFGTSHGLYRYDGEHLISFKHDANIKGSISNNTIVGLYVDKKGLLWITTNQGLNYLNTKTGKIKSFFHEDGNPNSLSNDFTTSITGDEFGNLWIGSINGLNEFNTETGKFSIYKHVPRFSTDIGDNMIHDVYFDHQQRLWVGTHRGLSLFDYKTRTFKRFFYDRPASSMESWIIKKIYEDKSGILWLGTWGEGLIKFNPSTGKYQQFLENSSKKHRGDHNIIFDLEPNLEDSNYLYLGTSENNICVFNKQNNSFTSVGNNSDYVKIKENCKALYNDKKGNLWIGSLSDCYKMDIRKSLFEQLNYQFFLDRDCLGCPLSTYQDELDTTGNTIWIGTWTCGLIKANLKTGNVDVLKSGLKRPSMENYYSVKKIFRYDNKSLWLGSRNGIFEMAESGKISRKFFHNKSDSNSLSNNSINDILKDSKNRIWIATDSGINLFNHTSNKFTHYLIPPNLQLKENKLNKIIKIIPYQESKLLVLEEKDIYFFDIETGRFTDFFKGYDDPTDHGYFYDIFLDSKLILWCAGTFGVISFKDFSGSRIMKKYSMTDGLSSDYATQISEDACGKIWIATRNGLNAYNPLTGKFKTYFKKDGLATNFLEGTMTKLRSDLLLIGEGTERNPGIMNYFDPCKWKSNLAKVPVKITSIVTFGKKIDTLNTFELPGQLTLSYKDKMIAFEFSALNFYHSNHNEYTYRLIGFDKEWIYAGNKTSATYTNLPPGKYTFHVKASNDSGEWNETGATQLILVHPPFYKTWWFYSLALLFVFGVTYMIYVTRINQIRKLYAIRSEISRDLHDDIGSRLSSISIVSQLADKKKGNPDFNISRFYEQVKNGSREALELMDDIVWSVNPKNDNFNVIITRMREYAVEILEAKNIEFEFDFTDSIEKLCLPMKVRKDFYLIYKEAVNNLAKYSNCSSVKILISKEQKLLALTITDNGKGFDVGSVKKGNGLNNMENRAISIKGNIHINSKIGIGTSIELRLPVT